MAARIFLILEGLGWFAYGVYCFLVPTALAESAGVVAQSPTAYASVTSPKVDLLINAPANDQEYIMPDFTARQLADVFDAAAAVGMKIASQPVEAPGMPPSSVVRQSPAPGTRVTSGTTIRLEVAK